MTEWCFAINLKPKYISEPHVYFIFGFDSLSTTGTELFALIRGWKVRGVLFPDTSTELSTAGPRRGVCNCIQTKIPSGLPAEESQTPNTHPQHLFLEVF